MALWASQGQTTASELAYGLGDSDLQVVRQIIDERLLPLDLQLYARHQDLARVRLAGVKFFLDGNLEPAAAQHRFDTVDTVVAVMTGLQRDRHCPGAQQLAAHGVGVQAADRFLEAVARLR